MNIRKAAREIMRSGNAPRYDSLLILATRTNGNGQTTTSYYHLGNAYAWQGACAHFYAEFCTPFVLDDADDDDEEDDLDGP
ncbi:MAG: hypothetical protein VXW99_02845 [Pseudomonadota bacterium]|nr:hypothetical protein [Pseudomonadota bacterium]